MNPPDTFITVAADCPADRGVAPESTRVPKPAHVVVYELLAAAPYRYTEEDLIYEAHVRKLGLSAAEVAARGAEVRAALFARNHPCMRASPLAKKFGWGVHVGPAGTVALVGRETAEYRRLAAGGAARVAAAMRNKRA